LTVSVQIARSWQELDDDRETPIQHTSRLSSDARVGGLPSTVRRVAVVGLGYVGLPTALTLFQAGVEVIGLDASAQRLAAIRERQVDLLPADHESLEAALSAESFTCTDDPAQLTEADAVIICVPTPVDAHLTPDLDALRGACRSVVASAREGQTIVLTSTSYVGSTRELMIGPLADRGLVAGHGIHVAYSPERIDPGNAQHSQDRVPRVVGGATPLCTAMAAGLLATISPMVHPVSSIEVAELTKLYENTFRAVNIALANEFADISRSLDLDVMEVIDAASTKPFGFMPFHPGPGVGGHCIPCDPHYLLWQLRARRHTAPLIRQAMEGIADRPRRVAERAIEILGNAGRPVVGARVLLVGIAYKPGVADIRESPALTILGSLVQRGAWVDYIDPLVPEISLHDGRTLRSVSEKHAKEYDLVVLHTLHPALDHAWVDDCADVLDATYRMSRLTHRCVP
jgi:UDP-N-acetyl-D-glucosamine dehydrogenase